MPRHAANLLTAEPPKVRMGFVPPSIKKQSAKNQLYIFNVGPKIQYGEGASYGRVLIPACPAGREYSDPYIVPGTPYEGYRQNGNKMDIMFHGEGDGGMEIEDPGFDWACQAILGFTTADGEWNGKFLHPSGSLEKFGIGIARQWPPSKEEIELAKSKLRKEDTLNVQAAREAHALGKFGNLPNSNECFASAHRLGLTPATERWMEFSYVAPAEEKKTKACPDCAEEIQAAAKKCRYCGWSAASEKAFDIKK